jgi:hypothetical protein
VIDDSSPKFPYILSPQQNNFVSFVKAQEADSCKAILIIFLFFKLYELLTNTGI